MSRTPSLQRLARAAIGPRNPYLRIFFDEHKFEHFADLVRGYAFSDAYEELMAAGGEEMNWRGVRLSGNGPRRFVKRNQLN